MRDQLSKVLEPDDAGSGVDRILAAAFFRKRPLQAGTSARVVMLAERRDAAPDRAMATTDGFLVRGG